ncbi:MAG TPA: signal recognition particle protein, partial [Armatimonadota bacterium]
EADVHFKVVKDFVARVRERAIGEEVLESLSSAQAVVKIVHQELVGLLGENAAPIRLTGKPAVILVCGLQGGGKTTSCGKLAAMLRKQGHNPLLVAADVYRPAAIKQLQVIGESLNIPVFSLGDKTNPVDIAKGAVAHASQNGRDVVILDTAGRLHVDEEMMLELEYVSATVHPGETLLVLDSMTGQDAVNVATAFTERLSVDGFILTKLDGDARGGAALSLRAVTDRPVKLVGIGEKLDALEPFHPDRMASRILGMGDVLSFIEKAQQAFDEKQAQELEAKLRANKFDFEDYLNQLQQMKKMGPLDQILGMIPGMGKAAKSLEGMEVDQSQLGRVEAIIQSMTRQERQNPEILNGSRRRRIAKGSGTSVQEINRLMKQFEQMRGMMRQLTATQQGRRRGPVRMPFGR